MKGGPAVGSERDITGKSMFCSCYCIIGWASLLGTRGPSSVAFDKARQFQELLHCQITVVHHAAPSPLLPQLLLHWSSSSEAGCLSGSSLYVLLVSMWPALWSRKTERRVMSTSWSGRQQPHLETQLSHCTTERQSDDPGAVTVSTVNIKRSLHIPCSHVWLESDFFFPIFFALNFLFKSL